MKKYLRYILSLCILVQLIGCEFEQNSMTNEDSIEMEKNGGPAGINNIVLLDSIEASRLKENIGLIVVIIAEPVKSPYGMMRVSIGKNEICVSRKGVGAWEGEYIGKTLCLLGTLEVLQDEGDDGFSARMSPGTYYVDVSNFIVVN